MKTGHLCRAGETQRRCDASLRPRDEAAAGDGGRYRQNPEAIGPARPRRAWKVPAWPTLWAPRPETRLAGRCHRARHSDEWADGSAAATATSEPWRTSSAHRTNPVSIATWSWAGAPRTLLCPDG